MHRPLAMHNERAARPVQLTRQEAQLLTIAVGDRLRVLTHTRAEGTITGSELDRRIQVWQRIMHKLDECIER